ncbi:MAG: 2-amino-4-hydroxy-6-hydroxymethyldihydropteridine diphosphokinase [Bacteroidetes bacterium]|nr:2-amino-4-hydroxy-6-hydroxymethyldihydropteridine diphosphokinase [Bacteroidota bacterium]
MNKLILSLGGNKGNVATTFLHVEKDIRNEIGEILKSSSSYKTAAWGNTNQPDFLNKVIEVATDLSVEECLHKVLLIEKKWGRIRTGKKWKARTIDIDILFYNDLILNKEQLIVPHPHLQDRKFVLIPLVEILPDYNHPLLNKSLKALLEKCIDVLDVQKV